MEESTIQVEKVTRLEAAQKKARIDLAAKSMKPNKQQKRLSPIKKPLPKIPKRKLGDSLDMSSMLLLPSDEEEEMLEEIFTDGARKSLLSPVKKAPKKSLVSPVRKDTGTSGARISDMFPDPASWPYNLT